MKKKNNNSSKVAVISTIVVIALVGISVFSLYSLAQGNKESDNGLTLATVQDLKEAENTNSGKLLSKVEEEEAVIVLPAVEAPVADIPAVAAPVAQVVEGIVGDIVVVDNLVETPVEAPAQEVATEEPAVVEEDVPEETEAAPAAEEPEITEPVFETVYNPTDREDIVVFDNTIDFPVYEEPVYEEPVYEAPAYEEPVYEAPVYEEPVYEAPVYEEPVYEAPVYEEPVYEAPVYEEPVYEEPVYEEPVYEEPVYEEPVYEEPVYEEPVYEEPVYVPGNAALGSQIAAYASSWAGVTPYKWWTDRLDEYGNITNSLTEGTDCSGFVYLVYAHFGIYTTTVPEGFLYCGTQVSYDQLLPGDVVLYSGHVGIYIGNDTIVHCANEDAGTIFTNMFYHTPSAYIRIAY